jgi:hypothetical protein
LGVLLGIGGCLAASPVEPRRTVCCCLRRRTCSRCTTSPRRIEILGCCAGKDHHIAARRCTAPRCRHRPVCERRRHRAARVPGAEGRGGFRLRLPQFRSSRCRRLSRRLSTSKFLPTSSLAFTTAEWVAIASDAGAGRRPPTRARAPQSGAPAGPRRVRFCLTLPTGPAQPLALWVLRSTKLAAIEGLLAPLTPGAPRPSDPARAAKSPIAAAKPGVNAPPPVDDAARRGRRNRRFGNPEEPCHSTNHHPRDR